MASSVIGISPKLPLRLIGKGGFLMNTTYPEMVKQNMKNLVLTIPGERMMDINFGVGLHRFLFEPQTEVAYDDISTRINKQVEKYMPYIQIQEIDFEVPEDKAADENFLSVSITYEIVPLSVADRLSIMPLRRAAGLF
tara:strand:- start:3607 stop:4020 length:414 start_codon:yes stop_codon:yes gene_type:complete